jgi:hypothetical protein
VCSCSVRRATWPTSALKIQPAPPAAPAGDALWGAPQPKCVFFAPGPGARLLLGAFCQTDFPGGSALHRAARGPALLLPHPSDTPAGLAPAGVLAQEVLPGRLPYLMRQGGLRGPHAFNFVVANLSKKAGLQEQRNSRLSPRHRQRAPLGHKPMNRADAPNCLLSGEPIFHTQKSPSLDLLTRSAFTTARDTSRPMRVDVWQNGSAEAVVSLQGEDTQA